MSMFRRRKTGTKKSTPQQDRGGGGGRRKDSQKIVELFTKYQDDDSKDRGEMGEKGLIEFFQHLGISPDDKLTLVFAWRWKCATPGVISRDEFVNGFSSMECETMDQLKAYVPKLKSQLEDFSELKKFYKFVFDYIRNAQMTDKRTLPGQQALGILHLLIHDRYPTHVENFSEYVQTLIDKDENFRVTADLWTSFLEFCKDINGETLAGYDESQAWPVILDEYVEWWKEHKKGKS